MWWKVYLKKILPFNKMVRREKVFGDGVELAI